MPGLVKIGINLSGAAKELLDCKSQNIPDKKGELSKKCKGKGEPPISRNF